MEPSLHGRQRLHTGDNNLLLFLSLMCLQDRETWNEPEIFRNVLIASFFTLGKPYPTSTLSSHPPPPPQYQLPPFKPPCCMSKNNLHHLGASCTTQRYICYHVI